MTAPESRNAQLVRLLQIVNDLDRMNGVDLYELAERHGATVRTIRRDLDALRAVGLPLVEETVDRRKRWRLEYRGQQARLSQLLDVSHYFALHFAMGQSTAARGTSGLYAALEDLAVKLEGALGPRGRKQLDGINRFLFSYEKFAYRRAAPEVFWPALRAAMEQRVCRVSYRTPRSQGKDRVFEVLPLRLFVHAGTTYMHAHVPRYDNVIVLNLHRLQGLEVLSKRGTPPRDFDPARWEDTAFGIYYDARVARFVLRFTPAVAPYIRERVWHRSQVLDEVPDGGVRLTLECSDTYEIRSWIASWRTDVEVLEPRALRREFAAIGRRMAEMYGE